MSSQDLRPIRTSAPNPTMIEPEITFNQRIDRVLSLALSRPTEQLRVNHHRHDPPKTPMTRSPAER